MSTKNGATAPNSRLHYLDSLRAFIMTFGVVLHAALWADVKFWLPAAISFVSALFRMKLFMILAGYFAALIVSRRDIRFAVKERVVRFAVPAIPFILIFNPLTIYLWHSGRTDNLNFAQFTLENFTLSGEQTSQRAWHLHIWFLLIAAAYALALPVFVALARLAYTAKLVGKLQKYSPGMSSLIVAVLTALSFLIGRTMHFALTQNLLHDGPYNYVVQALYTYAPYFLLGVMACKYETIFRILHHVSWAQAGVAILLLAFVRYNENATTAALGFPISEAIRHFSSALAGFYICCILINLFSMYFVDESRIGRFFSQASYTVYLFHMLALVVVQKVLLAIGITGIGLYLFSMILAFALCILIHVVIVRQSPSTELIFNGKLMGRQKAPTTPADVAVSGASG